MREIKFRMWNPITNTMIDLKKITPFALNIDTDGPFIPFCGMPLMQYTGIKDRNGKEIYEGDILRIEFYSDWVVDWYGTGFHIYNETNPWLHFPLPTIIDRTVIGNIYVNPELLEGK